MRRLASSPQQHNILFSTRQIMFIIIICDKKREDIIFAPSLSPLPASQAREKIPNQRLELDAIKCLK